MASTPPSETKVDVVPEHHRLLFPPFPPPTQTNGIIPFHEWKGAKGITVPPLPQQADVNVSTIVQGLGGWWDKVAETGRDSQGRHLNKVTPVAPADPALPNLSYVEKEGHRLRLHTDDCLKIGNDPAWTEPRTTAISDYSVARPPFSRLMDATLEFLDSRWSLIHNTKEHKTLFDQMRSSLGLRTELSILHWPGTGPEAQPYSATSAARKAAPLRYKTAYEKGIIGEGCPLLYSMESTIKGFLVHVVQEWNDRRAQAVTMANLLAAYMAFLEFHNVLSEPYFAPALQRATKIAKSAAQTMNLTFAIQDALQAPNGINLALWAVVPACGSPARVGSSPGSSPGRDDGGWAVSSPVKEKTSLEPYIASVLESLIAPLEPGALEAAKTLSSHRRRVAAVEAPKADSSNGSKEPKFFSTHYRLRTVPATQPLQEWSNLIWMSDRPEGDRLEYDTVSRHISGQAEAPSAPRDLDEGLEKEIDIWVDEQTVSTVGVENLIGIGIQGQWAEVVALLPDTTHGPSWWIVRVDDALLPPFWRQSAEDAAEAQGDVGVPYTSAV